MALTIVTIVCYLFVLYNDFAMLFDLPMLFLFSERNFICAILHGCTVRFGFLLGIAGIVLAIMSRFNKEDTLKTDIVNLTVSIICCIFLIL